MTLLTWTCEMCHKERPNDAISVETYDIGESMGLGRGVATRNLRYCNDDPECIKSAKAKKLTGKI